MFSPLAPPVFHPPATAIRAVNSAPELVLVDAKPTISDAQAWYTFLEIDQQLSAARVLYAARLKRLLDVTFASVLLLALAVPLAIVALIIWLDSRGAVLYKQERIGRFGVPFTVYKFRTMIDDRRNADLPFVGTDRRRRHKSERDPRVTRAGHYLRRASIDEWPQLLNVLRGDMSFIGPRPELPRIVDGYAPWQHRRHLVRPGMSGWWQIHGRSNRPMHENTELDLYYVSNLSFRLDVHIFLRTFRAVISRSGAF